MSTWRHQADALAETLTRKAVLSGDGSLWVA